MKRKIAYVGILALCALAMVLSPLALGSYYTFTSTQRETVKVIDGTMMYDTYYNGNPKNYDSNITLPWAIGDFNHTTTKICLHFLGPVHQAGFWNNRVFGAADRVNGQWANETLTIAISNGLDINATYSHINITCNNTDWEMLVYYVMDDVTDINSVITYAETDMANPKVASVWSVNDSLTFGTLPWTMDVNFLLSYPGNVASASPNIYLNDSVGSADVLNVQYQKYGPAHNLKTSHVTGDAGNVTVKFDSKDKLKKAVWDIDFTDTLWGGLLDNVDATTFAVKVNGDTVATDDITLDTTAKTLKMENLAIDNDDNTIVFSWTIPTPAPVPVTPTQPFYLQEYGGFPAWAIIGVIAVIVVVVIVAARGKK